MSRRRYGCDARWALLSTLCVLIVSGCGRSSTPELADDIIRRIVIIDHKDASASPGSWNAWLQRHAGKARRFPPQELEAAMTHCLASDLALVVTDDALADTARPLLEDYLQRGARLVVLGRRHPLPESPPVQASFALTSGAFRIIAEPGAVEIDAVALRSPLPQPRGYGGESAGRIRWIPAVEALGPHGNAIAWPGSVMIQPRAESGYSVCGWLAMEPGRAGDKLVPLVTAVLREATRDVYLQRYGLEAHSARAGDALQAGARMIDRRTRDLSPLRLVVEWVNRHDQELRRHVSPPLDTPALPTTINIGIAPEPAGGQPERFRVRLLIRDRNDQRTFDATEQIIKVFPRKTQPHGIEPITAHAGQLVQGRRPVFMLGVHYWPRGLGAQSGAGMRHWLEPDLFDPALVASDLDLMNAAGLNAVALEYTDLTQAPQVVYLLDELRKRSMWAQVYLPALVPFDVRMPEALRMLAAIHLPEWPEVYALEMARGLAVPVRAERRRLDAAWADWLDEHFNSPAEAEQKLGLSLWRERGRIAGPPDAQLQLGPHRDRAIALYYTFLKDYASRQMGFVRRTLRHQGYNTLLTARSGYDAPAVMQSENRIDMLDIATGALHQDLLSADAWTVHPLQTTHPDGNTLMAYARGMGGGKPVVWGAYGQSVGTEAGEAALLRQKEVYQYFLDQFLRQAAAGAFAWWYPSPATPGEEDWGVMTPSGQWRPVENVFRNARLRLRQSRLQPPAPVRQAAPLIQSARQWREEQIARTGLFAPQSGKTIITEWAPPGFGMDSASILDPQFLHRWSEVEGLHLLNAEWGDVHVADNRQPRAPGESIRVYTGRPLQLELINSGSLRWTSGPERRVGSIWIKASQPGHPDEWIATTAIDRGGRQTLRWTARDAGLWEIQPHLIGYGKFGERLRIEATTPPQLF
ncbi:MAG TPA: hypothetical protein PKE26_10655 [Kiritimatiellia bacterium]|nr:hypothetical protein [Kiritimatiellia bacterium]HMO99558.1 hypothetical protein [Kiritimatiellia bacterium]HMP97448.1 hypothetical protein [Kiritimatiellia bacterium]